MNTIITARPAQGESDFWAIHRLLVETVRTLPLGLNWDIRHWEGNRFYDERPTGNPNWHERAQLWETVVGEVVGAVFPEGRNSDWASLQLQPAYRHLEEEMVAWAEANIARPRKAGNGRQLHIFAFNYDSKRQALLAARGYVQMDAGWVIRQLYFGEQALAQPVVADGYIMRTTNPEDLADCQRIADLLNPAFGRTFHNAAEYQWFTRQAPCFRQYLDLVAEAPDGSFASYVGVNYDNVNQRGIFEPVCTHPDHRQRGLGKALMQEGLLRLAAMGAVDVIVETGDAVPANALYDSLGFTQTEQGYFWKKEI